MLLLQPKHEFKITLKRTDRRKVHYGNLNKSAKYYSGVEKLRCILVDQIKDMLFIMTIHTSEDVKPEQILF